MSQPLPPEPEGPMKGGFGAPIRKYVPKPATGVSKPQGAYGIVTDSEGRMKTTRDNLPKSAIEEAMEDWARAYNLDSDVDYLP